ncbi:MAG TPA: hypothetical protein PLQ13_05410 [Candidatus Krumholzibacteria bacterium]|nr:hypothetical protein [Candidatus Krumholzibacteria bacterium]
MPILAILALSAALAVTPTPPATSAAPDPAAAAVLARFIEAVGGPSVLARLQVHHVKGVILQDLDWAEPPHSETPFVAEADAGGCVRYAETEAWSDLPDSLAADLAAKLRWILNPRFALCVEEFFPGLTVAGHQQRAGRPVVVLAPASLPFEYDALFFDEETGLLNHVGWHDDLEDWRPESGILVPHRWVCGRKGGHTTYVFEVFEPGPAPCAADAN